MSKDSVTVSSTEIQSLIQSAQFSEALELIKAGLESTASTLDKLELLYLRAVCLRYSQKDEAAEAAVSELLQLQPDHARGWQERGYLALQKQQYKRATEAFYRATQLNPALVSAWQNIEKLYQRINQTQAVEAARHRIAALQALPRPLLAATDMMHDGKLAQADRVCRQFLQQHKHHLDALCLLADIAQRLKVYDDAEFLLDSAVELNPDATAAREQYIGLLLRIGKYHRAEQQASVLMEQEGDTHAATSLLASAKVGVGDVDKGIELFEQVLEHEPQRHGLWLELGHAYKTQGNLERAVTCYQQAYQKKRELGDAYWSLANTKNYQFTDQEKATMTELSTDNTLSVSERIYCHFALGKAFEDQKQYDTAFEHYQQGNQLHYQKGGYHIGLNEELVERQCQTDWPSLYQKTANTGCSRPDPIFIVGLPRAGSTLLEQILASHSQVDGTMELHNIMGLARRLSSRHVADNEPLYPQHLDRLDPELFVKFGQQFIEETQAYRQGAPFFIDKMPNNFMHIGLIKLILPNAKIIDARRHPMACCFSGYKQLFGEGQEFSYDLEAIGYYYRNYVKLMEHWDAVLPGEVLRVNHEDVVADLETQVRRMLDFCDLPFEPECLTFYKTQRAIKTPSAEQVRRPISTTGLAQWQHFSEHLAPLEQALTPSLIANYEATLSDKANQLLANVAGA